jgi:hypothetical protein
MTPFEKSEEIINKYLSTQYLDFKSTLQAKKNAIILVDEIINNVLVGIELASTWGDYWNKVKKEIEKYDTGYKRN